MIPIYVGFIYSYFNRYAPPCKNNDNAMKIKFMKKTD